MGSISASDCIACPSGTTTNSTGSFSCFPIPTAQIPSTTNVYNSTTIVNNPTTIVQATSSDENDDVEDPVSRSISIAAVVLGSVSIVLISLNFALNFYNKFLPNSNVVNKIPTDEKELEVI